jgi:hypothetical protein
MSSFLVNVSRRYNASSAGLKKLVGLDLRWDRRLTQFPYPMEKAIPISSGMHRCVTTLLNLNKHGAKNGNTRPE